MIRCLGHKSPPQVRCGGASLTNKNIDIYNDMHVVAGYIATKVMCTDLSDQQKKQQIHQRYTYVRAAFMYLVEILWSDPMERTYEIM